MGPGDQAALCRIQGCWRPLDRVYEHRKHLCSRHIKADAIQLPDGGVVRFCYRCGKLEPISCFDGLQRSCRARLRQRRLSRELAATSATAGGPSAPEPADSLLPCGMQWAPASSQPECAAPPSPQPQPEWLAPPLPQPEPDWLALPAAAPAAMCCCDEDLDAALLQCVLEAELAEAGARARSCQACASGGGSSASCSTLAPPAAAQCAAAAVCPPAAPAKPAALVAAAMPGSDASSGMEVHAARIWAWHERLASLQEQCKAAQAELERTRLSARQLACPDAMAGPVAFFLRSPACSASDASATLAPGAPCVMSGLGARGVPQIF